MTRTRKLSLTMCLQWTLRLSAVSQSVLLFEVETTHPGSISLTTTVHTSTYKPHLKLVILAQLHFWKWRGKILWHVFQKKTELNNILSLFCMIVIRTTELHFHLCSFTVLLLYTPASSLPCCLISVSKPPNLQSSSLSFHHGIISVSVKPQ